ncbi:hypothetical protein RIR_jg10479.t1 [Rhizophagus irregularis DAOM 181602=DAOM 197198]|nr:hypothetical protein RIR_jg10479.t1 [Rhizophagus irregularis DAOM 181602=DAOM 197198]
MQRGFGHKIFSNRNGEIETDYIGQKKLLHNSESHFYKRYKTGTNSYKENCQPCVEYLEFQKDKKCTSLLRNDALHQSETTQREPVAKSEYKAEFPQM